MPSLKVERFLISVFEINQILKMILGQISKFEIFFQSNCFMFCFKCLRKTLQLSKLSEWGILKVNGVICTKTFAPTENHVQRNFGKILAKYLAKFDKIKKCLYLLWLIFHALVLDLDFWMGNWIVNCVLD